MTFRELLYFCSSPAVCSGLPGSLRLYSAHLDISDGLHICAIPSLSAILRHAPPVVWSFNCYKARQKASNVTSLYRLKERISEDIGNQGVMKAENEKESMLQ